MEKHCRPKGERHMNAENFSRPMDLKKVAITDEFWGREQELVRREVIPYQWEALNDRIPEAAPSYCMRNFKVAGRLMREKREQGASFVAPEYTFRGFEALPEDPENPDPDKFYGFVFQDSDFAKWIEAVGYSLVNHPDPELEKIADGAIEIVCAAQTEEGYLDTYYIINGMDRIFTNLRDHHELYCFGHLVEGAVAYYEATGKDKLLKAAERYADFIFDRFGYEEGKCKGYPGHEIAEMALARLYEVTGEKKYLELCQFFLDVRGQRPYYFDIEDKERAEYEGRPYRAPGNEERFHYHQAHVPVREQSEATGHAVRAVYLYSGMADAARLTGDEAMFAACERLWNSIVNEKLYITGGIGGTHLGEAFSFPYDLPNDTAYSETCAAIGLAFFARRMLEIQADNRYSDVMESALYNTVLAGMALDGKSFFYVNPLEVSPDATKLDGRKYHVKSVRQKWFGCACCPPNIARIVSSIGSYIYTQNESTLFTHLYVGSDISTALNGKTLDIRMLSKMPWYGAAKMILHAEEDVNGTLAFRVPGWAPGLEVAIHSATGQSGGCFVRDGAIRRGEYKGCFSKEDPTREYRYEKGYVYVTGTWKNGDIIDLIFPIHSHFVSANTRVRENIGKVALVRGPLCYCLEEMDNGENLHLLKMDLNNIWKEWRHEEKGKVYTGKSLNVQRENNNELGHRMIVLKAPGLRQVETAEGVGLYADFARAYDDFAPAKEEEVTLTFVPYYAWNNRGEGEMSVWVRV